MLFLVATPIGNLQDITLRAIETLKTVDYILAEDTRVSKTLLSHFSIPTHLKRADTHKEYELVETVIQDIREGKNIALISDAGTPLIQDPGHLLLTAVIQENLPYTIIPGACAPIAALLLSGFPPVPFHFMGFIPKGKQGDRFLEEALCLPGTLLFFESPHRIHATLRKLNLIAEDRDVAIAREITKYYEEVLRGKPRELIEKEFRGELVLVIAPAKESPKALPEDIDLEAAYNSYIDQGVHPKEAIATLAKQYNIPKKELYAKLRTS